MSELLAVGKPAPAAAELAEPAHTPRKRLVSLDVFRGITVAGMLLVNNPGSWSAIYPPLSHAEWHGWTPTDLIFPFFLFIVGVSMTFSFGAQRERGAENGALLAKAAKRAAILVALGLVLQSYPWIGYDFGHLRFPGVLQRIGVASLAASAIVLFTGWRGRLAAVLSLLLGYWALMSWVAVPGVGAGVWEPGQDLGAYLDRLVFGTDHLWKQSKTWDPEGLLSTLPAVATVLLGVFAGDWLRSHRSSTEKVRLLLVAGTAGIVLGLLWSLAFPINKSLWTSSYVVFTAGMGMLGLGLCYWLIDVKGFQRWGFPFLLFGVNAIVAFFFSGLGARVITQIHIGDATLRGWLYHTLFTPYLAPINASLAFALMYVLFWMGVAWVLYRRGIFVKI